MKLTLRLFHFLDEIWIWLLLLVFFCIIFLIGKRIKNRRLQILLFAVFFVFTLVCEFGLQHIQKRVWEFFLIAMEFLTVPACLGFGISAVLPQKRPEKEKYAE